MRTHHRRFAIALAVSVLAHVALFTLTKMKAPDLVLAGSAPEQPMTVRIVQAEPAAPATVEAPTQAQQPSIPKPPPRPLPVPPIPMPRIVRKSPTAVEPQPPPPQPPHPPPP